MTRCKTCLAPIFYAIVASTGKLIPINAEPSIDGNVIIREGNNSGKSYAKVTKKEDPEAIYVSHFATCGQAKKWRKKKR